jgi:DNA (cytosine-5)-methyltransferase 1
VKHISLFSGIGGFDLAAEWAGWDNLASCEINPFGRRHLAYYWPEAYHHDDIKTLTGEIIEHEAKKRYGPDWRADGVILSGGFPCQPYSLAGKRLGKEDERHLWPEMLRVIREIKPDWIVGENVFGLVNWSDGLVFNEVQTDLEAAGYEVQAYVLPACAADAPHRRDRVWIVAHRDGAPTKHTIQTGRNLLTSESGEGVTTNANRERHEKRIIATESSEPKRQYSKANFERGQRDWHNFPTQSPVCSRDDGLSAELDGITFSKWRNESIKAAGNAIVPQIAYRIFQTINNFTQHKAHGTQSTNRPEQQHAGKITRTEAWHASGK